MTGVKTEDLGHGITCIDAAYVEQGMACFYLLQEGDECAVVETGTCHSVAGLEALLVERKLSVEQVRYVIPTHVHLDHAGGAGAMMALFPNAQLLVHPRGARHMADPERLVAASTAVYGEALFAELYGQVRAVPGTRITALEDGAGVLLAGRRLEFRHTRGHAKHHFCVWDEASRGWFSGDMFGISYPWFRFPAGDFVLPSTTPTQFEPQEYLRSLALLDGYGPERMYLTHYGALDYSPEKSAQLAAQVTRYCELACEASTGAGGLEQRLGAYSLSRLRAFSGAVPEAELSRMLAFDMQLNAQGLHAWLSQEV